MMWQQLGQVWLSHFRQHLRGKKLGAFKHNADCREISSIERPY